MIVPLVAEETWLEQLRRVPEWGSPPVSTCVIAPHPDDETLAAGGLICRLRSLDVPVSVVAVTDGENAYCDTQGLDLIREPEQTAALRLLGVSPRNIMRLRKSDSGVTGQETELTDAFRTAFANVRHIVAPWPYDYHPDHEACGRAAAVVAAEMEIPLTWYFFWTWHRGTPDVLRDLQLVKLPLTPHEQQAKREALLCHTSQLYREGGDPILPENLLAPAYRPFEVFLPA